jgi:hypothetical protein
MKIIVYGGEGWIGRQLCDIIKNTTNHTLILGTKGTVPTNEIDFTHVFSFIGEIGIPIENAHISYVGHFSKLKTIPPPNVLYLNMGIPINGIQDVENPITKIIKQHMALTDRVTVSVLPDLLPLSITLAEMNVCGIINLTNPDTVSHAEILDLYKDIVDSEFTPIKVANQKQIVSDNDGNGELSLYFPYIPIAKDSIKRILRGYKKHPIIDYRYISPTIINHIMTTNI